MNKMEPLLLTIEEINNKMRLDIESIIIKKNFDCIYFSLFFGVRGNYLNKTQHETDMINLVYSILYWFPFNIREDKDTLLYLSLVNHFYDLAKYLISLGSIPVHAILSHTLDSVYHIHLDFILYLMEKELDISWLYKLPIDSQNNIIYYIGCTDNEEELLRVFKYLASHNQFPLNDEVFNELARFGYNNCIDFFLECQVLDPEVILITAASNGTSELVQSLIQRGVTFNMKKIKENPINVEIEEFIDITSDMGHSPAEILEMIKYMF